MKRMEKIYYHKQKRNKVTGIIIKRTYATFKAIPCSLCGGAIKNYPSLTANYGNDSIIKGEVNYCESCHCKLAVSTIKLSNNFYGRDRRI